MLAATTTAGLGEWAVLALLSAGMALWAFLLAQRARLVVRAGLGGTRAHPGPLVGLLCGGAALALMLVPLIVAWSAGWDAATAAWDAQRGAGTLVTVGGWAFMLTDPGRRRGVVERTLGAHLRAHPRQARGAFLVGAATWALLPVAGALPAPARSVCLFAGLALLLAEVAGGYWWQWRHGRIEEIADGQRTVYHPAFWGWISGTATTLLLWTTLARLHLGR